MLILAAVHLDVSDIFLGTEKGTYSIPTVIEGTVDPFCVGNAHRDCSTVRIRGRASVNVRAISGGAMTVEEGYCIGICFVPA